MSPQRHSTSKRLEHLALGPNRTLTFAFLQGSVGASKFLTQEQLGCEGGIFQIQDLSSDLRSFAVRFGKCILPLWGFTY